ncbi:MAG: putative two-component system response regulator [Frankiales bacterium]|nr:putative two-component system response regulator [Frankiales bacterium]
MSGADKGLVLVVEDEPSIAEVQRLYLVREGFTVHIERDGVAGLAAAQRLKPVAVVLDVGLPGMDGTQVCRTLREQGDWVPVLFVTARDEEVDRVLGLELGADDYLTKPFSPRELVSRVRAVLRRSQGQVGQLPLVLGPIRLEPETRTVTVDGQPVALTVTEFDLLAALMRKPGRVLSREQLLSQVWGYAAAAGTRTVDVHVGQVRAKLGAAGELLTTVRGVGYATARPM